MPTSSPPMLATGSSRETPSRTVAIHQSSGSGARAEQCAPALRIEQQRQRMKRHQPQQRGAGFFKPTQYFVDAVVPHQPDQKRDAATRG
jgi:hypothetical protein